MIEVLDVVEGCSSPTLSLIIDILKNVFLIMQIVGPIALIIVITLDFMKLMTNPDDKKTKERIKNSIFATLFLFLIPFIINITMTLLGNSFSISACWNSATSYQPSSEGNYSTDDGKRKKIINSDSNTYDKGLDDGDDNSSGNGNSPTPTITPYPGSSPTTTKTPSPGSSPTPSQSPSVDGTATSIGDIVYDPNDVTKISNITAAQLTAVLNSAFTPKAKNFIPYVNDLIAVEHKYSVNVFFLLGIQAYEASWASSDLAKRCNNLGGIKSSPRSSRKCTGQNGKQYAYFNSVGDFIDYQGELLSTKYLKPGGSYYYGKSIKAVCTKYNSGRENWTNTVTEISTKLFNTVKKIM